MDESTNIVSDHDISLEGIDIVVDEPLKIEATSTNNGNECSTSPSPSESEKKTQRTEICSVYSGQKPTVYINPIIQTDPSVSISDSVQIDVSGDQPKGIGSNSNMESIQLVSEVSAERSDVSHQQLIPEACEKNVPKINRRRRSRGTIIWEPLLVPSEMDGKIEMVTALKRVDSDYISAPRVGPKKHEFNLVKQSPFRPSHKTMLSSATPIKPSKSFQSKAPDSSEKAHGVAISKQRASGSNIKVQMDKAIAEKEASILKEIETAMREAAKLKSKSSVQPSVHVENKASNLLCEKTKPDPILKSTVGSILKKKKIEGSPIDPFKDKARPKDKTTEFSESTENIPTMESTSLSLESTVLPEFGTSRKVNDTNNKCSNLKTSEVLQSASSISAPVKDSFSSGKIITTFGTVISTSVANGSGITAIPKILTLPSSLPPPLAPLSKDVNPVNRIASANVNPNSPSTVQRILVLATPAGMKNVGGDSIALMPITPIVTTSSLAVPPGTTQFVANNSIMKSIGSKEKVENPQDVHLIVTNFPYRGGEPVSIASSQLSVQGIPPKLDIPVAPKSDSQSQISFVVNAQKPSTSHVPTSSSSSSSSSSSTKRKQKMQKTMNRELASLVIDCNNVQPISSSTLRARNSRVSPKAMEDKSCNSGKIKFSKEISNQSNESKKSPQQKSVVSKTKTNSIRDSEQELSSDKKRQKSSPSKAEKKNSTAVSNLQALKEKLKKVEQLYNDLPPAQPQISLTSDNYADLRHSIRTNLHELSVVSETIKHFISVCEPSSSDLLKKASASKDINKKNSKMQDADASKMLCRLCGSLFKKDSLIALFSDLSKEKNLLSMFSTILPQSQSIKEADGLPQHICITCTEKLTLCFNIINQFLQADKKLRNALCDKNENAVVEEISNELQIPSTSDNLNIGNKSIGKDSLPVTDSVWEESSKVKSPVNSMKRKRSFSKELEVSSDIKRSKEKETYSDIEKGRSIAVNPVPNHKHKRKHSKSPENNKNTTSSFTGFPNTSGACIDLSRLDPEFNDGFEVEWCLDEETIRSSLVPEEETLVNLKQVPVSTNDNSLKSVTKSIRTYSASVKPSDETSMHKLPSLKKKDLQNKEGQCDSETSNVVDEVSKMSETQTTLLAEDVVRDHIPIVASEDQSKIYHDKLFQSQETFKCPSCPLSFPNKKEAFLHKVMKHEDEITCVMKPQDKKLHSRKTKYLPKKVDAGISKAVITKTESLAKKSNNEPAMCDLCGHSFPNEYALYIHKCVEHDNYGDGNSVVKDAEDEDYQIISSKPLLEESPTESTTEDSDGKILVKCGTGMLLVNSSKLISDEQKTPSEAADGNTVEHGP